MKKVTEMSEQWPESDQKWKKVIKLLLPASFLRHPDFFCCLKFSLQLSNRFHCEVKHKKHFSLREKERGWKTKGRGKQAIKPLPKNGFPPPMIRCPPPLFMPCHFLRGNGHRPDQSHFLSPPKPVLGRVHSIARFPPKNRTIRFAPRHF